MKLFDFAKCPTLKSLLMSVLLMVFVAGCGGGGDPPPSAPSIPMMKGSALIPGGGTSPKAVNSKILPGTVAFGGATITARSLTTGTTYSGTTSVDSAGNFAIEGAPFGDDYLVTARKGNIVVMKIISVGGDAASPYEIGEVDAASTAAVLMLNNLLGDLGLVSGNNPNLDQDQINAIHDHDPAQIEINIENVVSPPEGSIDPPHVDETGGNPINIDTLIIKNDNSVNIDNVVYLNTYLYVFNINKAGDQATDESGLDALNDWLTTGSVVGITVTGEVVEVTVDTSGFPSLATVKKDLKLKDLDEDIRILADPETTLTEKPALLSNSSGATFEFTSDQSSVTFKCEIDGAGFSPCTSPHSETGLADGNHTFLVAAINADGKIDLTPVRYVWEVDATAPDTTIDTKPANPINSTEATFEFSSDDSSATFECKINDGGFSPCTSPKTYTGMPDGTHTFMVRAIDPAGNVDATPASYSWTIDTTGPVVSIDPPTPADPTKETTATFHFSANEAATFTCDLNGTVETPCTSPKDYPGLPDGAHIFSVSAVDALGNPGNTAPFNWTVENDAPDTILDPPLPDNPSSESSATFNFHSTEEGSTFNCRLDIGGVEGTWESCVDGKNYSSLAEASYQFNVKATDLAGNTDPTPAVYSWAIVTDVPETILDPSLPSDPTSETSAVFMFSSDKSDATFECKLDLGDWAMCESPINPPYTGLLDGTHTFLVRAKNTAGTDPSPETYTWTVDTVAPDTIIDTAPSDPSASTSATFTFRSTEAGSSFECQLSLNGSVLESFANCDNPKTYEGLAVSDPDKYKFEVKATDAAGNPDLSPDSHEWATVIVPPCSIFCEDFEGGIGGWSAETGVWQIDTPTIVGPVNCFQGSQCGGTVMNGNYPVNTDSRFISPGMILPATTGNEEIHLRFWNWFSYAGGDLGRVQLQVFDPTNGWPVTWINEGAVVLDSSGGWALKDVDLTPYAGKTIRIAFYHVADCCSGQGTGWYIDNIKIEKKTPTFTGDFEAGIGDWFADRGVWQVGMPTAGPGSCFNGSQCVGTVLTGNYPVNTDSSLISATQVLGAVSGNEEIRLRFWNWFSYAGGDLGRVRVQIFDSEGSSWGPWVNEGAVVLDSSGGWALKDVDLTPYAGKTIRIAFYHVADCCSGQGTGWYIDDIKVEKKTPAFTGDFEAGIGDWFADRGVWQVGMPTAGPGSCFGGSTQCAGTVLNGNYPVNTDSSLISATQVLGAVSGNEEIHLRFWNWFSYAGGDLGQVRVQIFDSEGSSWGPWVNEGAVVLDSSGGWALKDVDLTPYAGKTIRIAFYHVADCCSGQGTGWYIDNIKIEKKTPTFTGDFEAGIGDWFADRGVWQVGMPTAGPGSCFGGSTQCAGTVLNGNYPVNTDSRFINNAPITLPPVTGFQTIRIRFENWFSYAGGDWGQVQIQVFDPGTSSWGGWENKGTAVVNSSGGWTTREADLGTTLAGKTIRIAFSQNADCCSGQGPGWYLDNIRVVIQ